MDRPVAVIGAEGATAAGLIIVPFRSPSAPPPRHRVSMREGLPPFPNSWWCSTWSPSWFPPGIPAPPGPPGRAAVVAVREETGGPPGPGPGGGPGAGRGRGGWCSPEPLRLRLVAGEDTLHRSDPGRELGVERVGPDGPSDAPLPPVVITYDALGIGRMASATLRFQRGRAVSTLVVSSLGRATR